MRNADFTQPLGDLVLTYAQGVTDVAGLISTLVPPSVEKTITTRADAFAAGGAPPGIARRVAELRLVGDILTEAEQVVVDRSACGADIGGDGVTQLHMMPS